MHWLYDLKRWKVPTCFGSRWKSSEYYFLLILGVIFVVGIFLGAFFFSVLFPPRLVGKVSFDIPEAYERGSTLAGTMIIDLKEGELLPRATVVSARVNEQEVDLPLESLATENQLVEGTYFIQGLRLAGEGDGYGLVGSRQRSPEVTFELRVLVDTDEDRSESTETTNTETNDVSGAIDVPAEEQNSGGLIDDSSEVDFSSKPMVSSASGSSVTAAVINEETVYGTTRADNSFSYDFFGYDDVMLVPGSVKVEGNKVADDVVQLVREGTRIIVRTNYVDEEMGFGSEFLGQRNLRLVLDLSAFGFTLNQSDTLFISLRHEDTLLVEAQKDIAVGASITGVDVSVEMVRKRIVLGEPVQWKQRVDLSEPSKVTFELPEGSTDVQLVEIVSGASEAISDDVSASEVIVSLTDELSDVTLVAKGARVSEEIEIIEERTPGGDEVGRGDTIVALPITGAAISLGKELASLFSLPFTGRVIEEAPVMVSSKTPVSSVEVYYSTEAPYAVESEVESGKEVTIVGPETVFYENVLAFTQISESLNVKDPSRIAIYWKNDMSYLMPEEVLDRDANGIYDFVSWNVPHLSNQTFTIIVITSAQHLTSNRTFISDIYDSVKALDGNWSETIPSGDYVRVTFEMNLSSDRDITLYPRVVGGTPSIDIYAEQGNDIIASFTSLANNEYNKVFLSNLIDEEDTFDMHVLGGVIELDHIIDPEDTNVASCRLLNESGTYTQTANIVPNVTGACINITASGVTFDGAGFWIFNSTFAFAGIYSNNVSTVVKNCNVTASTSSGGNGVEFYLANYSQIVNCTLNSQRIGAFMKGSSHILMENNTINSNTVSGISVGSPTTGSIWNLTIRSNKILFSGIEGIDVTVAGADHLFVSNTINNSVSKGITFDASAATVVKENVFGSNPTGIDGSPSSNSIVLNNTFYNSSTIAITVSLTSNFTIENNTFWHSLDAITLSDVSSSVVRGNLIHNSTRRGISVSSSAQSANNYIVGGIINGTGSEALRVSGVKTTNLTFANITLMNSAILDLIIATANLNGTSFENLSIGAYNFTGLGNLVTFRDYNEGEIVFKNYVNGTGLNLSSEIMIEGNFIFINSSNLFLNKSANVTLYNLLVGPLAQVLRNGGVCTSDSSCTNTSTLNLTTITFNISKGGTYTLDLLSCLGSGCTEGDNCSIVSSCTLHNNLCTDSVCHFKNFTINGTLYAGHTGGAGLARNLTLNVSESLTFLSGGIFDFAGLNTSTGNGGNAGIFNITMMIFNRTKSNFSGYGGYAVQAGASGGNGGILQFNYHTLWGGSYGSANTPNVSAGSSSNSLSGVYGSVTRVKDSLCPRDVDVNNNGIVNVLDLQTIRNRYNNVSTDSDFTNATDIQCDNKVNVIDISKLGFEYGARPS